MDPKNLWYTTSAFIFLTIFERTCSVMTETTATSNGQKGHGWLPPVILIFRSSLTSKKTTDPFLNSINPGSDPTANFNLEASAPYSVFLNKREAHLAHHSKYLARHFGLEVEEVYGDFKNLLSSESGPHFERPLNRFK